jgi:hypothetical protein
MSADTFDTPPLQPLLSDLERSLIHEFLRTRGYDPHNLAGLSDDERHAIMAEASTYASTRLMEVEARSHLVHEIHGDTSQTGR